MYSAEQFLNRQGDKSKIEVLSRMEYMILRSYRLVIQYTVSYTMFVEVIFCYTQDMMNWQHT